MIIFQLLHMLLIGEMIFAMKSFLTNARLFKHDCWVIVAHPGMLGAQFGIGKNKEPGTFH